MRRSLYLITEPQPQKSVNREAVSAVVTAIIAIVAIGIAGTAYYLATSAPGAPITTSTLMTSTGASSTSSTTSSLMSTSSVSSSTSSSATSSSNQTAHLQILAVQISHSLAGTPVTASCGSAMPPQGSSYFQISNDGTVSSQIRTITFDFMDMSGSSGAPNGSCVVGPSETAYVVLTGIGGSQVVTGQEFSLSILASNGGFATIGGAFA
jgi:hypothetical protein